MKIQKNKNIKVQKWLYVIYVDFAFILGKWGYYVNIPYKLYIMKAN